MTFTTDDLKPLIQYILPILGGLWFVVKLIASQWSQIEKQKHQALVKDQVNLKELVLELKTIVGSVAQAQANSGKEMTALRDLILEARLEIKDHRVETVKANDETKEMFRRWIPIMKSLVESHVTQIGKDAFLVSNKKPGGKP